MNVMNLKRVEAGNCSIYVQPEIPYYFVPNSSGDKFLKEYLKSGDIYNSLKTLNIPISKAALSVEKFLNYLRKKTKVKERYTGRIKHIEHSYPKEVWLHITNKCNLKCRHCLFSNTLNNGREIPFDTLINLIDHLNHVGTNIFIFTGGEPFLYPDFHKVVNYILNKSIDNNVAILTNALLIKKFFPELKESSDLDRIHFQISCEGIFQDYEKIRGVDFKKFLEAVEFFQENNLNFTIGIDLINDNFEEIVDFFIKRNIRNFHFFYHIPEGKGREIKTLKPENLSKRLINLKLKYENIFIDNLYSIATQVFAYTGVKHDLTSAGFESFAISPELKIYPTAATVFQDELCCGDLYREDLLTIWNSSKILNKIRNMSVANLEILQNNPFKFINGGGDLDLSYFYSKEIYGKDPFIPLYDEIIKFLISEEVNNLEVLEKDYPEILFEYGDKIEDCGKKGEVFLNHSNCLLSFATDKGIEIVQSFYKKAALNVNRDIVNPFMNNLKINSVPDENLEKSYGCGSPVVLANIKNGERVLDLGSGSGVESLIASESAGNSGFVVGVDMLDEMLKLSEKARKDKKRENLAYIKGFIEKLPFKDESFDVVMSNCVINLSNYKKKVFRDIYRILKENGRIVISDVVTENELPVEFMQDEKLKGECISGVLTEEKLFDILRLFNFSNIKVLSRVFYREVKNFKFYSITFSAEKSSNESSIYFQGPSTFYIDENFNTFEIGKVYKAKNVSVNDDRFVLDKDGINVINKEMVSCCELPPEKHESGCLICGSEILYFQNDEDRKCSICGKIFKSNSQCAQGHFICDNCHRDKPLILMEKFLLETDKIDMLEIFATIREMAKFPMHGPEYHSFIPGIIVTSYRNCGGNVSDIDIKSAINRGKKIPGGSCAFMGVCGVVTGIGIAISVILKSTPLKGATRTINQKFCSEVLNEISNIEAARCCQRESVIGLKFLSSHSKKLFGIHLPVNFPVKCFQYKLNRECAGKKCILFPEQNRILKAKTG